MSKSKHKIPFIGYEMFLKCFQKKEKNIVFFQRNTLVPYCFTNINFEIYRGKGFKSYNYRNPQLGLKLGEFAWTRSRSNHRGKRLKIKKKRQKLHKPLFSYDLKKDFFTR